jgi:hypothetical protein
VLQFASSLVVSIVVAIVTVQLSLWRFHREKWWERKLDAYTRVIEALHHMQRSLDVGWKSEVEAHQYDEAFVRRLGEKASAGWDEVRKAIAMGELLLSPSALAVLQRLMNESEKLPADHTYFDYVDQVGAEVERCLAKFVPLAKDDLKLSDRWFSTSRKKVRSRQDGA